MTQLNWRQKTVQLLAADPTKWVRVAEIFCEVDRDIPIHLAIRRQPQHKQADISLNTARWRMFLSHISPLVERVSCDGSNPHYRPQRTDLVRLRAQEEPCATCGGPRYLAAWPRERGRPGPNNGREYFCLMGCNARAATIAAKPEKRGRGRPKRVQLTLVETPYEPDIIDWTAIEPVAEFVVPEPEPEAEPVLVVASVQPEPTKRRHRAGKKHRKANGRSYPQPLPKPQPSHKPPPQDKPPLVLPMPVKRQYKPFIELGTLNSLQEIWDEYSFECRGPRFQERPELVRGLHRAFDAGVVDEYYRTPSFYDVAREMVTLGITYTTTLEQPNHVHINVNVKTLFKVLDTRGAEWVARKMNLNQKRVQRDGSKYVIAFRYAAASILSLAIHKRLWVVQPQIDALLTRSDLSLPSPLAQPQPFIEMIKHPIQSIRDRFGK